MERDVLGRVIKELCGTNQVSSKYDTVGNRIQILSNLGADIKADYNLMGDLMGLNANGWVNQYKRDLFGLEIERSMTGGLSTATNRDNLGRVTGHKTQMNARNVSDKSYIQKSQTLC